MIRVLAFLLIVVLAAFAATWLADRPGDVVINWQGYRIETSVAVGIAFIIGAAALLAALWSLLRIILKLPSLITMATRNRKRARGYSAVSRGMIAVGAGDAVSARRFSAEADRLLGPEPLTLLLKAQSAQIRGDRGGAEAAFRSMLDTSETRVLGLRGLYVEARRRGDDAAAHAFASEAARLAPAAAWASEAVFERQCLEGDWNEARATLDRRAALKLIDKAEAKRGRAALLTAQALADDGHGPDASLALVKEALKLDKGLVPAAALAGRLLAQRGDLRRAAKVLETAWKEAPHPDLADTYINLRSGDSARDRLARARRLSKLAPDHPDSRIVLTRAALEAGEFALARETLAPLLADRPTTRVCLLAADLEQADFGATGKVREWLARAARAPRDPMWISDGVASDTWSAISPVTGRVATAIWASPAERLTTHGPDLSHEDETPQAQDHHEIESVALEVNSRPDGDRSEPEERPAPEAEAAAPAAIAAPATETSSKPAPAANANQAAEPATEIRPNTAPAAVAAPAPIAQPAGSTPVLRAASPVPDRPRPARAQPIELRINAPDDPGPDLDTDPSIATAGEPRRTWLT